MIVVVLNGAIVGTLNGGQHEPVREDKGDRCAGQDRRQRKDDGGGGPAGAAGEWADDVEATMLAARALVAISAQSVAAVDDVLTAPQLRVLVMFASRGPLKLGAVARGLGVHPSNAIRACGRLVSSGLLDRSDDPADRRTPLAPDIWARRVDAA